MTDTLYQRIQYQRCRVFDDGYGGIRTKETDVNGNTVVCCRGGYEGGPGWESVCRECLSCDKYIRKVIGEI